MFKVGDIVKVEGGRRGDRYRVISIRTDGQMIMRNIRQTDPSMNFLVDNLNNHLVLDEVFYRKEKMEKIMDTIDSINILRRAKQTVELNRKIEWMYLMEIRKRKIQKICSTITSTK